METVIVVVSHDGMLKGRRLRVDPLHPSVAGRIRAGYLRLVKEDRDDGDAGKGLGSVAGTDPVDPVDHGKPAHRKAVKRGGKVGSVQAEPDQDDPGVRHSEGQPGDSADGGGGEVPGSEK